MWAVLLTAALFYAVFPLVGAGRLRSRWARFRRSASEASAYPDLDFIHLHAAEAGGRRFRLTGRLEAFEGDSRLWIGNGRLSAPVSLAGTRVYFLDEPPEGTSFGVEPPRTAGAADLGALPEGTQFVAAGPLVRDAQGRGVLEARDGGGLLVLAFEGDPETALTRAVYAGRPAVDHWNSWTPLALGAGVFLLMVLAYLDLRTGADRRTGLAALALALLPATFFLPPGILFFYWFLRLWTRGRECRAWADLARAGGNPDPQAPRWDLRGLGWELAAQLILGLGMLANGALLVFLLRLWVP